MHTSTPLNSLNNNVTTSAGNSTTQHCGDATDHGTRMLISIIFAILIFFSLTGNILLCSIVYRRPSMRSGINLLLANLALSDFVNAVLNLPLSVVLFNLRTWPLGDVLCGVNVVLCFLMNIEKVTILTTISIDRYFIIVKRKDTMTPTKAYTSILITWLIAFSISLLPVMGWGRYGYQCGYIQCLMDIESGRNDGVTSYLIFSTTLTIFLPALILLVVYSRIFRTVHRSCFRVENHPPVLPTAMHRKGRLYIDYGYKRRTSATILILCLVLMTCLMPIGVLNIHVSLHGFTTTVTRDTYLVFLWISYIHGAINPVIYFSRIKKFREAVYDVWPPFCTLSHFMPYRSRRRIRPHVTYTVDKCDVKVNGGGGYDLGL